ncbi:MAG: glycosyltransferase [Cyanobacteriota bacterium]|nr:glycosyltransferase [Cyanobacteriota bacterium]
MTPDITIAIPAYQGKQTVCACLKAIEQAADGWNHEILVIESSKDGSRELIQQEFPSVVVIGAPCRLSAGEARNLAVQHARGHWLFFVDQDCLVPIDWIPRLLQHLKTEGVGGAGGSIAVANPKNISGWCVFFLEFLHHFPNGHGALKTDNFLIGANSSWRTEILKQTAFPAQTLGEDLHLSERVKALGYTIIYDSSVTVYHYNRSGWQEFRRYCRAMGRAAGSDQQHIGGWQIRLIKRFPLLVFAIPLIILPLIAWRLRTAPTSYLPRFLILLPCCLWGQLMWAKEFRMVILLTRYREAANALL